MSWKKIQLATGNRLFQVHNFTLMHGGKTYTIEIDEFQDGTFTGHGEHSTDKSDVIESVNGKTLHECLESLVSRLQGRK